MAEIRSMALWRHLRAEPNQHVLHFSNGKLKRSGAGLSYWFNPLSAAVAQVPVEDCETTILFAERSVDFQEITVQVTLTYRVVEPEKAARRVNFSISTQTGAWVEQPLERLASIWSQRAQDPARRYLSSVPVVEAVRSGAEVVRKSILDALRSDTEIAEMGITVVEAQVVKVAPTAELEKALQTPTREAIQQKADEAGFSRRANAVEKERVIKENELATELELAKRQELLIEQQGRNKLMAIQREAESEKQRVTATLERGQLEAQGYVTALAVRAEGEANARRMQDAVALETEARRIEIFRGAPTSVVYGFAAQTLANKLSTIQHLNITPDLLRDTFMQTLRDSGSSGE
jgi:regulator of protease activity HflC (stomatin/prohibitin superfamily)